MKIVKALVWIAVILGAICGVLYETAFDVWRVPDDALVAASVAPTLRAGDLVVVTRSQDASRGHLVRCADPRPENPGQLVVGRVLAVGTEEVDINNEVVSVDHRRNPSPYGCTAATMRDPRVDDDVQLVCSSEDTGETKFEAYRAEHRPEPPVTQKVEPGHVFLVSDNRHIHQDSRDFGAADPSTCQHVLFRLWSKDGIADAKSRFTVIW